MSQLETRFTLDNTGFIQKMVENGTVTEREANRMTKSLKYVSDQMKVMQTASKAANDAGAGIKESSKHVEEFGFKTAGAKRELLVLAHELSQGNYSKFGGSMLVLGERTGAAALLFSSLGLSVIGATAVLGAFAFAAIKGHMESDALAQSLRTTGNFAGTTEGQFNALAKSVSASSGTTIGASRQIVQAMVSTGQIGPALMDAMSVAGAKFAAATGQDAEKVAAEFAKMGDGVAKFAVEHNKSMNFLTGAQYEHIKRLEEQGKAEQAQLLLAKALSDHLGGPLTQNLGNIEQLLHTGATWWTTWWDHALDIGRTKTPEQRIQEITDNLAKFNSQQQKSAAQPGEGYSATAGMNRTTASQAEAQRMEREGLNKQILRQADAALAHAEQARIEKAKIAATDYLDHLNESIKGVDRLKIALEKLHREQDAYRQNGGVIAPAVAAAQEKKVREDNMPARGANPQDKLDSAFTTRMNALGAEGAKLDAEIISWEKYGRALDHSRLAVVEFDIAQGKLIGKDGAIATSAQKLAARTLASAVDAKEQALNIDKASASYEKHTRAIGAATEAGALNARQSAIAADMQKLEESGILKGTTLYTRLAAARTAALNGEFDTKGTAEAEKRSKAIAAMADAQELNARQTKIAVELEQIEASGLIKGTALYSAAAVVRTAAVNAEFDGRLKLKLAAQQLSTTDEVHKIDAEAAALGLGTLAKINAAHASKLYAQAQVEIAANPGMTAQILDAMVTKTNQLADAEVRLYKAKREFGTGVTAAFQKYQEAAGDSANFAEKMVTGSFSRMEDALVNFTKTGKLNLGSMFQFMADEFIRQQIRMQIASAASGAGGGGLAGIVGSLASSYFSGNGGAATSVANALPGDSLDNLIGVTGGYGTVKPSGVKLATGTNYVPYDGMQATLHKGEAVVPAAYNPAVGAQGRSSAVTLNIVNNGAPVRAQSSQRETNEGTIIDLVLEAVASDMSGGGRVHDATQRRFGLNPGGTTPRY